MFPVVQAGVLMVAVLLGAIGVSRSVGASHFGASSLACVPDVAPRVLQCTLTIGPLTNPVPSGDVIRVSLTGGTLVGMALRAGGTCSTGRR